MKETLTLPRPMCRVSVLDAPDHGWDLDIAGLLAADAPRAARQTLAAIRARPASLEPAFPDDLRAAIRAGIPIEIEDTGAMLDRFLDRIGGAAGFEQWSALLREEQRLRRLGEECAAEAAAVTGARLFPITGQSLMVVDRWGRHGSPAALIAQAAWDAGVEPQEWDPVLGDDTAAPVLRGKIAPYLWGGRAVAWTGPQNLAEAVRRQRGDEILQWMEEAWRRECPQAWDDPENPGLPDLAPIVSRWQARSGSPEELEGEIARLARETGCTAYQRDTERLYAVFAQTDHREIVRWCEEACLRLEERIAEIPSLWREPVQPGVRQRWAQRGIAVRTDGTTGAVVWSQASRRDPLGVLENGPFLTLEMALEDIAARALPGEPDGRGAEEIA